MSDTERSQSPQLDQPTPVPDTTKGKEEGEQKNQDEQPESSTAASTSESTQQFEPSTAWQAIWSPQHNAYYFYNTETQETTWSNPLQPEASSSASTSTPSEVTSTAPAEEPQPEPETIPTTTTSSYAALQAAALAQGIDPSLAYLDPTLAHSLPGTSASSSAPLPKFTAKFNARTGTFTRADARDPGHLSEYERAKRFVRYLSLS